MARGIGCALAFCAAVGAEWGIRTGLYRAWSTGVLVAAALVWAWLTRGREESWPAAAAPEGAGRAVRPWIGWALALAGAAVVAAASRELFAAWQANFDHGAPLLVAGVALASIGLRLAVDGPANRRARWRAGEVAALVALVALAFFLRFHRYHAFPPADGFVAVEEAQSGLRAHQILHQGYRPWEFVLDRWLAVPFFARFGESLTVLRIPFTIVSGLTVPALYLLARCLVSRPAAFFGAFLLAVAHWHLIYARYAHAVFPVTLVVVVTLWLSVLVVTRERLWPCPWIGLLAGTTAYSYAGYRGTPLFVAALALGHLAVVGARLRRTVLPSAHRALQRRALRSLCGWGVCGLVFLATVAPLWPLLRQQPGYYVEAANRAVLGGGYYTADVGRFLRLRYERLRNAAGIFHHRGDPSPTTNIPGEPMLDPAAAVWFTLGLAGAALRPRKRLRGFFLFVFLVLFFFGTIFPHNLDVRRLQVLIPLVCLLAAYAADTFLGEAARYGAAARAAACAVLVSSAAVSLFANWDFYFRRMMNDPRVRVAFHNPYTSITHFYRQLAPEDELLLVNDISYFFLDSDYAWWRGSGAGGRHTTDLAPVLAGEEGTLRGGQVWVLLAPPFETEEAAAWLERWRGARCRPYVYPPQSHLRFAACRLGRKARAPKAGHGFASRYVRAATGELVLARVQPAVAYALTPDECRLPRARLAGPCRASWEGTWAVPGGPAVELLLEAREAEARLFVDGREVAAVRGGAKTVRLHGPATVALRVEGVFGQAVLTGVRLRWRPGPSASFRLLELDGRRGPGPRRGRGDETRAEPGQP